MKQMFRLLLTGATPKDRESAASLIKSDLEQCALHVFVGPDIDTYKGEGMSEESVMHSIMDGEDCLVRQAREYDSVVIFRGGALDAGETESRNIIMLRDGRYDAVVILKKNDVRLFEKTVAKWEGHHHLRIFDSEHGNMHHIQELARHIVGVPQHMEVERKYLIDSDTQCSVGVEVEIWQTYLRYPDGSKGRLRKRGMGGEYVFFHTSKTRIGDGRNIEEERIISETEYSDLQRFADCERRTVHKLRRCFVWEVQYFELDTFLDPRLEYKLLEIEDVENPNDVHIPPFLKVVRDVTGEAEYSNSQMARIK